MEKKKQICSKCGDEYDTYRDGECQTCEIEEEREALRTEIPFVAFGNNEISAMLPAVETIKCKRCHKKHKIKYGTTDGKENRMLGFVNCGKATYLATIEGKLINK